MGSSPGRGANRTAMSGALEDDEGSFIVGSNSDSACAGKRWTSTDGSGPGVTARPGELACSTGTKLGLAFAGNGPGCASSGTAPGLAESSNGSGVREGVMGLSNVEVAGGCGSLGPPAGGSRC